MYNSRSFGQGARYQSHRLESGSLRVDRVGRDVRGAADVVDLGDQADEGPVVHWVGGGLETDAARSHIVDQHPDRGFGGDVIRVVEGDLQLFEVFEQACAPMDEEAQL